MAVELAVVEVVGAHYGPGAALAYCGLEGGEVDLVERAVVQVAAGSGAADFLVVHREVLYARGNAVFLHTGYIGNHHLAGEERVFSHILEVAAVERGAADVYSGPQQNVFFTVTGLLSYAAAEQKSHIPVPGGCKAAEGGEGCAGVVGPAGLVPLVPENLGTDAVGTVGAPDLGNAQAGYAA